MQRFLTAFSILVFCAGTYGQKPKNGSFAYVIAFAEWGGKSLNATCTVIIKGDSIKVVHDGNKSMTGKKGDIIEEGIIMIVPTLSVAIWISWRTRDIKSELAHNLAIVFWISANAYWMISEFFGFDTIIVWREFTGKHMALIPFIIGAAILLYYYLIQRPKEVRSEQVVTMY